MIHTTSRVVATATPTKHARDTHRLTTIAGRVISQRFRCLVHSVTLRTILALLTTLAIVSLHTPLSAQEVAILKSADIAPYNEAVTGFKASMPNTARFLEYNMKGDTAHGRKLARKIRASNATVVLAVGLKAAMVAKLEIIDTPVIFSMVLNPEKYALTVPNMIGISLEVPLTQQLDTLRAMLPRLKRIGLLYDPKKTAPLLRRTIAQAKKLGITIVERTVKNQKQVPQALRILLPDIDALWLTPDSTVLTEDSFSFLLGTALDQHVPVIGFSSEFARSGALLSLSVNYMDIGHQAGQLAQEILAGKTIPSPNLLPPDRQRIALNLKTAKFLGITIAPGIVSIADEVY